MADTNIKCSNCKRFSNISDFKKNGKVLKNCILCRTSRIKSRTKNKCIHNLQKYYCVECGGSSICIHNRRKYYCVECGGSSICEHKKQKHLCIECNGSSICEHKKQKHQCVECHGSSICEHNRIINTCIECNGSSICEHKKQKRYCKHCSDELEITIKNMICGSKHSDKKYNRYDIVNFIDKSFLKRLIEDSENKCYYCKCQLQYMIKQSNLATIERLNNSIGHVKSNCVISCYQCNVSKVGNKLN